MSIYLQQLEQSLNDSISNQTSRLKEVLNPQLRADRSNGERNAARQTTLSQLTDTSVVRIHVGPEPKVPGIMDRLAAWMDYISGVDPLLVSLPAQPKLFLIHKELLYKHSAYFSAALRGNFRETDTGMIEMKDEDPDIFARFESWVYTGSFYKDAETAASWHWALDLYLFAEKRFIPDLQNDVMDAMLEGSKYRLGYFSPETEIPRIWPLLPESSPLISYFVDVFAEMGNLEVEFDPDRVDKYPIEFVAAVAVRAQQLKRKQVEGSEDEQAEGRCERYHVRHGLMETPCRKMVKSPFEFDKEQARLISSMSRRH